VVVDEQRRATGADQLAEPLERGAGLVKVAGVGVAGCVGVPRVEVDDVGLEVVELLSHGVDEPGRGRRGGLEAVAQPRPNVFGSDPVGAADARQAAQEPGAASFTHEEQHAALAGNRPASKDVQPGREPDVDGDADVGLEGLLGAGELAVGGMDEQTAGEPFDRRDDERVGDRLERQAGRPLGLVGGCVVVDLGVAGPHVERWVVRVDAGDDGELFDGVSGAEVLGDVLAENRFDNRHGCGDVEQRSGDLGRMVPTALVAVGRDDHVGAGEHLAGGRGDCGPLSGAAGVAGGGVAGGDERVGVLLALHDEHSPLCLDGAEHLRQPVRHAGRVAELPDPTALAVGAALAKGLRLEPDDLVEQLAGAVGVVVGRDDPRPLLPLGRLGEQVGRPEVDRGDDVVDAAIAVAMKQHGAVVAAGDRERRRAVRVSWAQCAGAGAVALLHVEALEDELEWFDAHAGHQPRSAAS